MSISINYIKQIISLQFIIHFSYFPTTDNYISFPSGIPPHPPYSLILSTIALSPASFL